MVYVRQDQSSDLSPSEIKQNLDRLGDQIFTGTCTLLPLHRKSKSKDRGLKVYHLHNPSLSRVHAQKEWSHLYTVLTVVWFLQIPEAFNIFDPQPLLLDGFTTVSCKEVGSKNKLMKIYSTRVYIRKAEHNIAVGGCRY